MRQHEPLLAAIPGRPGQWGVFCGACTELARVNVYPCRLAPPGGSESWPNADQLVEAGR